MPQIFEVEGIGPVEFADGMTDDQIAQGVRQIMKGNALRAEMEQARPTVDDTGQDRISSYLNAIGRGAVKGVGQTIEAASRVLTQMPVPVAAPGFSPPPVQHVQRMEQERRRRQAMTPAQTEAFIADQPGAVVGRALAESAPETYPTNPRYDGFVQNLAESAGGMIPTIAAGAVAGPVAAAAQYGLSSGQQGVDEAVAAGAPEEADFAFLSYLGLGAASEALLGAPASIWRIVKGARAARLPREQARAVVLQALQSGVKEGAQEALEQTGQNTVANLSFDPERGILEGVPEAAAAGAVLGGGVGGGAAAVGRLGRPPRAPQDQTEPSSVLRPPSSVAPPSNVANTPMAPVGQVPVAYFVTPDGGTVAYEIGEGATLEDVQRVAFREHPGAEFQGTRNAPSRAKGGEANEAQGQEEEVLTSGASQQTTTKSSQTITGSNVQTGTEMPVPVRPGEATLPPVPEPPNVLDEQVRLALDPASTRAAVLVTPGATVSNTGGLLSVDTEHGTVLYNPQKTTAQAVAQAGAGDVFDGTLLGMSGQPAAPSTVAVTTSTPSAKNVVSELVQPGGEAAAVAAQQQSVPGGTTEIVPAAQVIEERKSGKVSRQDDKPPELRAEPEIPAPPATRAEPQRTQRQSSPTGAPIGTKIGRGSIVWEKREDGWYSSDDGIRRPKADAWLEKQLSKPEKDVRVVLPSSATSSTPREETVPSTAEQEALQTAAPPAKTKVKQGRTKAPWQMTRVEHEITQYSEAIADIRRIQSGQQPNWSRGHKRPYTKAELKHASGVTFAQWKANMAKMDARIKQDGTEPYDAHKEAVQTALLDGKPVPAEVLVDYPELQKPSPSGPGVVSEATEPEQPKKPTESEFRDLGKTGWLKLFKIVSDDPQTTDAWRKKARDAMRRLSMGAFASRAEAQRFEDDVLRPLFRQGGVDTSTAPLREPEPAPSAPLQREEAKAENPYNTSETSNRLTELQKSKPSSVERYFGKTGGTPEQRVEHEAKIRKWNSEYRKALKSHKEMVEKSNEWIRSQSNPRFSANAERARQSIATATKAITDFLGVSTLPERVSVVYEPDAPYAGYFQDGRVVINAARTRNPVGVLLEEGMHGVWSDPELQAAWREIQRMVTETDIERERARRKHLDTRQHVLREEATIAKIIHGDQRMLNRLVAALRRALGRIGINLPPTAADQIREAAIAFLKTRQNTSGERRFAAAEEPPVAPATDRILSALDSLKLPTDGLHAFGVVPAVWNTAIDTVKLAIRGGAALAEAIQQGIDYIKANQPKRAKYDALAARQTLEAVALAEQGRLSPEATEHVAVIEGDATRTNVTPDQLPGPPPQLRSKVRDALATQSGVVVYYGSPDLLRDKQELDMTAAYQASAVSRQSDALMDQLFSAAHAAQTGFKLPRWMRMGAWARRVREFKKRVLHVAARLNATGRNPDGSFAFTDFQMRAGMMTPAAFKAGKHQVGDTIVRVDPDTGIQEQFTIGPLVTPPDGRVGYQLYRSLPATTQAELYQHYARTYPELIWLLDMFIDPALANVRKRINGIEVPIFNRFAAAAMMAANDPNFTPLTGYTPDVLISRSLLGAITGTARALAGTRSPGRKYKFGTSREQGNVRDLLSGFNVRTFQMLQENARRQWRDAVLKAATPVPKTGVPAGWVTLEQGMESLWQAVKRLRHWHGPTDPKTGLPVFEQVEERMTDDGSPEYRQFFGEVMRLRGQRRMVPQRLLDTLQRSYVAHAEHSALYKLGAWLVRNSTQLFLAHPVTYVANVGTNELFALEAATRYGLAGLLKGDARDLRFARNLLAGMALNRFAGLRKWSGLFADTDYMRTIREVLPDGLFADQTSLADVKVRWGTSPLDYLREGEIGAAVLGAIQYGQIDVRAKQRLAFAMLKANAVTNARRAGLRGRALRSEVERYLANPPAADRLQAINAANFELLNYADTPDAVNSMARNDYGRLVLPFPRFGAAYLAKQGARLGAVKDLLAKVPKRRRADALADLVTVAMFGLGGAGALAFAAAGLLGDDDDEARRYVGTSTVPVIGPDGSVTYKPIDRSKVTANRVNLSHWARLMGLGGEGEEDFWVRVRNYPVIAMAGVAALAVNDAAKYGPEAGARQLYSGARDLATDFFSVGAAVRVPAKVMGWDIDPYGRGVPTSFYVTEQIVDSFVPGTRQADEIVAWLDPIERRRTPSKALGYQPGVTEAVRIGNWGGVADRLLATDGSSLPPAGRVSRSGAVQVRQYRPEELLGRMMGVNIRPINREDYEGAIRGGE